jgi:hypothetical protein
VIVLAEIDLESPISPLPASEIDVGDVGDTGEVGS